MMSRWAIDAKVLKKLEQKRGGKWDDQRARSMWDWAAEGSSRWPYTQLCSVDSSLLCCCCWVAKLTAASQAPLTLTISWSLLKFMSTESVTLSNHFTLCCPLLFLPSIFPSIKVLSNESILYIKWLKYWSFSFSISPSNEYSGLITFKMDWLDLLAVQWTLKVFSNTTGQKHQFFSTQLSLYSNSHIHTWLLEKS